MLATDRERDGIRSNEFDRGPGQTLLALAQALLPKVDAVPQAPERVTRMLLEQAHHMSPMMRFLFFVGLRILEWSPLALFRAPHRLSQIPAVHRRELFERWQHSRLYTRRQLALAYNGPIFMAFYDLPEMRGVLRYGVEPHLASSRRHHAALLESDPDGRCAPWGVSMVRR